MKRAYWENRKESTIERRYGHYIMKLRYMANCNHVQVSIEDISLLRFPLMWSKPMTDEQANAAMTLFEAIGYFDMPIDTITA